ncbi:MAG: hypothetical protein MZU95_14930 [Desulfomicrobium escambiense]|nr:hypothetical protein [Desulfomicrobium escambiense]
MGLVRYVPGGTRTVPSARAVAGVDRALEGRGVECLPVARRPEGADVERSHLGRWAGPRRWRGCGHEGAAGEGAGAQDLTAAAGVARGSRRTLPPAGRARQSGGRTVRIDLATVKAASRTHPWSA